MVGRGERCEGLSAVAVGLLWQGFPLDDCSLSVQHSASSPTPRPHRCNFFLTPLVLGPSALPPSTLSSVVHTCPHFWALSTPVHIF